MANYVPVIESPTFLAGLGLFGLGHHAPRRPRALRLAARRHAPRRRRRAALRPERRDRHHRRRAARARLVVRGAAGELSTPRRYYELLFWGGGHVLQFTWTLLLLVAWLLLADAIGARVPLSPRVVALLFGIGLAAVFATPLIYPRLRRDLGRASPAADVADALRRRTRDRAGRRRGDLGARPARRAFARVRSGRSGRSSPRSSRRSRCSAPAGSSASRFTAAT